MRKRSTSKLVLTRDTIRRLTDEDAGNVGLCSKCDTTCATCLCTHTRTSDL